jgi:hypothetical protein
MLLHNIFFLFICYFFQAVYTFQIPSYHLCSFRFQKQILNSNIFQLWSSSDTIVSPFDKTSSAEDDEDDDEDADDVK